MRASPPRPRNGGATATRTTSRPRAGAPEELLARLDSLGEEIGRLDTARLPSIRDALATLTRELDRGEPDGTRLRELFERLLAEVEALHTGALTFMGSLGNLMQTVEQVEEDEFERGKGALLEHLQGFRKSRMPALGGDPGADRSNRSPRGSERLVATIVDAEEFVELPGGASIDEQRAPDVGRSCSAVGKGCSHGSSAMKTGTRRGERSTTKWSTRSVPCSRSPSG